VRLRELTSSTDMSLTNDVAGHFTTLTRMVYTGQLVDHVGDGIPDWWRQQYFGGNGMTTNVPGSCAACDPDGDGMSNLAEFLAGTDPTNNADSFHIISIGRPPDGSCQVVWMSVPGINYQVWATTDLSTQFAAVSGTVPSAGATTSYTDVPAGGVTKYYKIKVLP
jgi:hypothetical protein